MRKVANPEPPGVGWDDRETVTDLVAEFPSWVIKQVRQAGTERLLWRGACADTAGHLAVETDSAAHLWEAMDELDRVICRHAAHALRDELRDAGVHAEVYGLTVCARSSRGTVRCVTAYRSLYVWTSGVTIGTVRNPGVAARAVLAGLGAA